MSEDNNLEKFHCSNCGIVYGLDKEVVKIWKNSHKGFFCPNGHGLVWPDKNEQEKLEEENKSLKEKVAALEIVVEEQKKNLADLKAELEIWKPSSNDKT